MMMAEEQPRKKELFEKIGKLKESIRGRIGM